MKFNWFAVLAIGATLQGCADATLVGPTSLAPQGPRKDAAYDGSVPYFGSRDEIPPPWWSPAIFKVEPIVYWSGATATAASSMYYFGNRAQEDFVLSFTGISNETQDFKNNTSYGGFFPDYYTHTTPGFSLSTRVACGHTANLSGNHIAKSILFVEWEGLTEFKVSQSSGRHADQPDCPTAEKTESKPRSSTDGSGTPQTFEQEPTYCTVWYMYDIDTGEILARHVLYCW